MSIRVMTHVWADKTIQDPHELLIMLALADFSNDKGESFPAIPTLAKKCRLTDRGVFKVLERLTNEKNPKVIRGKGGGRGKSNLYTIVLPDPPKPDKNPERHSVNTVQGKQNPERHSMNTVPETLNRVPKTALNPEPGSPEPLNTNRQETTTTCAPAAAKAATSVTAAPSSSFLLGAGKEEKAAPASADEIAAASESAKAIDAEVKRLVAEFGGSEDQIKSLAEYVRKNGVDSAEGMAEYARKKENRGQAFWGCEKNGFRYTPKSTPPSSPKPAKPKPDPGPDGWDDALDYLRLTAYQEIDLPQYKKWREIPSDLQVKLQEVLNQFETRADLQARADALSKQAKPNLRKMVERASETVSR